MKKLLLFLFIIKNNFSSGTILELIKPYRIIENDTLNAVVMGVAILGLNYVKEKGIALIQPIKNNQIELIKNEHIIKKGLKLTLKNCIKVVLSPIFLLPILINIQNKNQIVSYEFLLKYLIASTSAMTSFNLIKDKLMNVEIITTLFKEQINDLKTRKNDLEIQKKIEEYEKLKNQLSSAIITYTIIYKIIIQIIIKKYFSQNINLILLNNTSDLGKFCMYLFSRKDPENIDKINPYLAIVFVLSEAWFIKNLLFL